MAGECKCEVLDATTEGGGTDPRSCPEHAYEAGRRHERTCYVEERDRLRDLLSQARIRLDQHIGMCACPGEACVSACRECNTTQDLVNRIRAFMQGR
jgi:hypothetical protein